MNPFALWLLTIVLAQNLISNGDFELYGYQYCGYTVTWCGTTESINAISPWYLTGTATKYELSRQKTAYSGEWYIDLNSDQKNIYNQQVTLVVGKAYQLRYAINVNYATTNTFPLTKTGYLLVTGNFKHSQ